MFPFDWHFVVKSLAFVVICFSTLMTIFMAGPYIETRYFPVVSKMTILRVEPMDEAKTRIWAAFEKRRNCEYIGIGWFRGTPTDFERVVIVPQREDDASSPNRPIGYQRTGPWDISMPMDEIEGNSFVELWHRCHPFWMTTTHFYP